MKITFDIDCTAAEARAFLGLPDLTPVHDLYVQKMTSLINDGIGPADFERLTRTWLPGIADSVETWRQAMFSAGRTKDE